MLKAGIEAMSAALEADGWAVSVAVKLYFTHVVKDRDSGPEGAGWKWPPLCVGWGPGTATVMGRAGGSR